MVIILRLWQNTILYYVFIMYVNPDILKQCLVQSVRLSACHVRHEESQALWSGNANNKTATCQQR